MADKDGATKNGRRKSRPLNYFYLNGKLHKKLHINRGADTITTWCYPDHRRVAYTYSDVLLNKEPAYTLQEVGKMLNRRPDTIERAILEGNIVAPQYTYGLDENKHKYKYMWHESDIIAAHEYFSQVHKGRPRKDGLITPMHLPTLRELRAIIRQQNILYVRDEDGSFRPTWQAANFKE